MVRFDKSLKRPTEEELKKWYQRDTRIHKGNITKRGFEEWKTTFFKKRLEVTLGFNTKQFWVYDNTLDVLIDPPTEVLDSLTDWREDSEKAEKELADIVAKDPDWIYDRHYWYDGQMEI